MRSRRFALTLLGLFLGLAAAPVSALVSVRDQEIAQCLPGEIATWGDGQDRPAVASPMLFVYDHTSAPPWFTDTLVLSAVKAAAAAWSQCGIGANAVISPSGADTAKGTVLVQWSEKSSGGNFGLANLTQKTLSLGPSAFQMLKTRNPAHDARETLQMVISHEMGHLFGLLAHSRRCVDVTSYYNNGKGEQCLLRDASQFRSVPEYRSAFPTACDLQRCRRANGNPQ
jgi:hypothetical protein